MATPAPIVEEAIGLLNEAADAAEPEPQYPTGRYTGPTVTPWPEGD